MSGFNRATSVVVALSIVLGSLPLTAKAQFAVPVLTPQQISQIRAANADRLYKNYEEQLKTYLPLYNAWELAKEAASSKKNVATEFRNKFDEDFYKPALARHAELDQALNRDRNKTSEQKKQEKRDRRYETTSAGRAAYQNEPLIRAARDARRKVEQLDAEAASAAKEEQQKFETARSFFDANVFPLWKQLNDLTLNVSRPPAPGQGTDAGANTDTHIGVDTGSAGAGSAGGTGSGSGNTADSGAGAGSAGGDGNSTATDTNVSSGSDTGGTGGTEDTTVGGSIAAGGSDAAQDPGNAAGGTDTGSGLGEAPGQEGTPGNDNVAGGTPTDTRTDTNTGTDNELAGSGRPFYLNREDLASLVQEPNHSVVGDKFSLRAYVFRECAKYFSTESGLFQSPASQDPSKKVAAFAIRGNQDGIECQKRLKKEHGQNACRIVGCDPIVSEDVVLKQDIEYGLMLSSGPVDTLDDFEKYGYYKTPATLAREAQAAERRRQDLLVKNWFKQAESCRKDLRELDVAGQALNSLRDFAALSDSDDQRLSSEIGLRELDIYMEMIEKPGTDLNDLKAKVENWNTTFNSGCDPVLAAKAEYVMELIAAKEFEAISESKSPNKQFDVVDATLERAQKLACLDKAGQESAKNQRTELKMGKIEYNASLSGWHWGSPAHKLWVEMGWGKMCSQYLFGFAWGGTMKTGHPCGGNAGLAADANNAFKLARAGKMDADLATQKLGQFQQFAYQFPQTMMSSSFSAMNAGPWMQPIQSSMMPQGGMMNPGMGGAGQMGMQGVQHGVQGIPGMALSGPQMNNQMGALPQGAPLSGANGFMSSMNPFPQQQQSGWNSNLMMQNGFGGALY